MGQQDCVSVCVCGLLSSLVCQHAQDDGECVCVGVRLLGDS